MSLEQQIEESWKEYVNGMSEEVRGTVAFHSDVFEAGFRAALASLYVEVKPEDVRHRESYWCLTSSGWKLLKWLSGMEWWDCHAETAYRTFDVSMIVERNNLPSPSSVFGGGA